MMLKKMALFIVFLSLILPCISILVEAYKPGETIHFTYKPNVNVATKPKFIRYTIFDPSNTVIYEEDHPLTYVKEILPFGLLWTWYDEYDFTIPGFSTPGKWRIQGRLFSEALWVIEVPDLFPLSKEFTVEETSLLDNLFAPWYMTIDSGPLGGRMSFGLPFHPALIFIIVVAIFIAILIIKTAINVAVPVNGGKKK